MGDPGAETLPEELVPVTMDGDTDGQDDGAVAVGEADCAQAGPPVMEGVVWDCRVASATAPEMRHADATAATKTCLRMAHQIGQGTPAAHRRKPPSESPHQPVSSSGMLASDHDVGSG